MPFAAPIYDPGQALTGRATGASVIGARFLKAVGPKVNGGNIPVAHAAPGDATVGVSQRDAAQDKAVAFYASGHVLNATAAAAVAAGKPLKIAAGGKVVETTLSAGDKVATSVEAAAGDGVVFLVQVQL